MPEAGGEPLIAYFGFGSLVNRHTLRTSYVDLVPATLKGWRRHWQARTQTLDHPVALLSVHEDQACEIQGMLVVDRLENLPAVDEREEGYSRHVLSTEQLVLHGDLLLPEEIYVYVADEDDAIADSGALLQSYLDAVLQGFHQVYGQAGVSGFVETTSSFDRVMIRDRAAPLYPRSVALSEAEREVIDAALAFLPE